MCAGQTLWQADTLHEMETPQQDVAMICSVVLHSMDHTVSSSADFFRLAVSSRAKLYLMFTHLERIPQLEISSYIPSMNSTFSLNLTLSASSLFPVNLEFSTPRCLFVQVFIGSSLCWDRAHLISHWKKLSKSQIIIIDFFWTLLHLPTFF